MVKSKKKKKSARVKTIGKHLSNLRIKGFIESSLLLENAGQKGWFFFNDTNGIPSDHIGQTCNFAYIARKVTEKRWLETKKKV